MTAGTNKFEFLFEDAKKRKEYKNSLLHLNADPNCTFKPDIDKSQQKVRSKTPILTNNLCTKLDTDDAKSISNSIHQKHCNNFAQEKHKRKVYNYIFQQLDIDMENAISYKKIDLNSNLRI